MRLLLLPALVFLTGCGTLDIGQCKNAYEVGFRDGLFGLQRQDDLYQAACSRQGIELDAARYAQGWQEGKSEFDSRTAHDGAD